MLEMLERDSKDRRARWDLWEVVGEKNGRKHATLRRDNRRGRDLSPYIETQNNDGLSLGEIIEFCQFCDPDGVAVVLIHAAGSVAADASSLPKQVRKSVLRQTGGRIPVILGGSIKTIRFDLARDEKGLETGRFIFGSSPVADI